MSDATIKQHVPIFISSTYEDMIPYREEVQRGLTRFEQIIKGMEYFGSSPEKPLEKCVSELNLSEIYIGIIGMRYGSVDDVSKKSFTQIEYEKAVETGKPILIYIIDENHPIPSKFVDTGDTAKLLQEFKNYLKKSHTITFFTTPQDLGMKVSNDLQVALDKLGRFQIGKLPFEENGDSYSKITNFWRRPKKYSGYECILTMKIVKQDTTMLSTALAKGLDLTVGDVLCVDVSVLDESNYKNKIWDEMVSLCAQSQGADWLEEISVGSIIKAKIRFAFATIQVLKPHDGGVLKETLTYKKFILVDGIEVVEKGSLSKKI
jgi:hypothetical protein